MTSSIDGYEQSLCLNCIKDIAQTNINTLIAGIENSLGNEVFLVFIYWCKLNFKILKLATNYRL